MRNNLKFAWGLSGVIVMVVTLFAFSMTAFVAIKARVVEKDEEGVEDKTETIIWTMPDQSFEFKYHEHQDFQVCNVAPTRIIDGDTFTAATTTIISPTLQVVEITGFRLLGVDTPERREEGYQEAKDHLRKRIGGKLIQVRLKQGPGKKRDSFGRFLVDVFLCTKKKFIFINDEIIEKKLGKEYPR